MQKLFQDLIMLYMQSPQTTKRNLAPLHAARRARNDYNGNVRTHCLQVRPAAANSACRASEQQEHVGQCLGYQTMECVCVCFGWEL